MPTLRTTLLRLKRAGKLKSPHRGHFQLSERAFAAEEDDDAQEDAG
jgi:DNA-binding transcriptional regulator PaaX